MHEDSKSFEKELLRIRLNVIRFLLNLFLAISLFALIFFVQGTITASEINLRRILVFSIVLAYVVAFYLCRKFLNSKNYKFIVAIILIQYSVAILIVATLWGTYSPIIYPMFIAGILTTSIVIGSRAGIYYTLFIFACLFIVFFLHDLKILEYSPTTTESDLSDTLIMFFFIGVVVQVARIGYFQIEHSYTNALKYSKELETMNKELDLKVKERTELLKNNFDKQIESMYTSAVVGNITRPLLHDLATPISVLEGVMHIANSRKNYDEDLFLAAEESVKQVKTLIIESRELMRGNDINSIFNVTEHIKKVIKIIINELRTNNIEIRVVGQKNYMVEGIVSFFERVIINILVNAIEELKSKPEDRNIKITIKKDEDNFVSISIRDNGRGVPLEHLEKIFQEDFSFKNSYANLGLGLNFVKNTIVNKFNGSIKAESKVGKYTKFILRFPLTEIDDEKSKTKYKDNG